MALSQKHKADLELYIRNLVTKHTDAKYIGYIDVTHQDNMYMVRLLGSKETSPIIIGFMGEECSFLEFIEKELQKRRLHLVSRTRTVLAEPDTFELSPVIKI